MFTGIITHIGKVVTIRNDAIVIESDLTGVKQGDSVSVNGVCLTAKECGRHLCFDMSPSTRQKTALGFLTPGRRVNIELALKAGERIGGHFVLGHIDGTARIYGIRKEGRFYRLTVAVKPQWMPYIAQQGSVAIDGVSLTVNRKYEAGYIECMLIPATYKGTAFCEKKADDIVNIELDILMKSGAQRGEYVRSSDTITWDFLKERGYF